MPKAEMQFLSLVRCGCSGLLDFTHPSWSRYRCYITESFSPCGWKQQNEVISFLAKSIMQALKLMQLVLRERLEHLQLKTCKNQSSS